MAKVSILVPVYNVEKELDRCLDSLQAQTHKDLEIILINDGSTDSSLQIAQKRAQKDSRIQVHSYENSGIATTRNRALQKAAGDYIMFVDSDDYIEQNMVERLLQEARKHNLDLVQCGFTMDYRFGKLYRKYAGHIQCSTVGALKLLAKGRYFNNYPWGKLISRKCLDRVRFPAALRGFEDTYTIFKFFCAASRAGTIPDRLYHYVQRRGSLTNRMSMDTVRQMRQAYLYQKQYLEMRFAGEEFDFEQELYNVDMVLIYTLIVFVKKSDREKFVPYPVDWSRLPFPRLYRLAYRAWLGIAVLKLGTDILNVPVHEKYKLAEEGGSLG